VVAKHKGVTQAGKVRADDVKNHTQQQPTSKTARVPFRKCNKMPILAREQDIHPENLLDQEQNIDSTRQQWYAMYTRSRCEKQLMRNLVKMDVPFYGPTIPRRYRSPAGRLRVSHDLLFSNYVFVFGDEYQRHAAESSNCVTRSIYVPDGEQLRENLRTVHRLIEIGRPLTPEARLQQGDRVRVRSGPFAGFEGVVIRRQNEIRLLVTVDFTQHGASVLLDDCQLEILI
jgi:transcription antitermination factor NusG